MRLEEFKKRVKNAFGDDLQNATPANVREFLDGLQQEIWRAQRADQRAREHSLHPPIEIPSTTAGITWESLIREFFLQSLEVEHEQAIMMLWIFAFDLAYSGIEDLHAEKFNRLFQDMAE